MFPRLRKGPPGGRARRGVLGNGLLFAALLGACAVGGWAYWRPRANPAEASGSLPPAGLPAWTFSFPPGVPAPDLSLLGVVPGEKFRLASFRGKRPVVLMFGSFT
jgi:hypothetical protein